jgi:hypothetical protein
MQLVFVNWAYENHGSAQDLYHYTLTARSLGHEVALYGPPNPASPFNYSLEVNEVDAVIFIFEFTTRFQHGEQLGLARLLDRIPRERRVILDCDGKYNKPVCAVGDYNHRDEAASRRWTDVCDSISDKIFQPTLHPLRPNVRPFFFHAYDPAWEVPLDASPKEYGMCYVGTSWFRWRPLQRVLRAIEPVRDQVGRIGLVGLGWDSFPPDVSSNYRDAYYTDPAYLRKMGVEVMGPVSFDQVIPWMSKGVFSPVIYRPIFDRLRLVTCRTFETPAANTIPLFCQDAAYVREIYGEGAVALVLPDERPHEKILDVLRNRGRYAAVVRDVRRHLAEHHSYVARLRELLRIVAG